ncbi:hypothetical protein [Novosphingobium rosa]|uniref:hypothetical protein n=1 Tax=Novosphingobium rosa TaxID=76978 RepID=UPI0012ED8A7F|nr:hypothetical protein [Novosphingobium rosa]
MKFRKLDKFGTICRHWQRGRRIFQKQLAIPERSGGRGLEKGAVIRDAFAGGGSSGVPDEQRAAFDDQVGIAKWQIFRESKILYAIGGASKV